MGCLGNSKTEDQRIDEKAQREANKKIEKQLQKERLAYKATHRLLLLGKEEAAEVGAGASGASGGRRAQPREMRLAMGNAGCSIERRAGRPQTRLSARATWMHSYRKAAEVGDAVASKNKQTSKKKPNRSDPPTPA